MYQEYPKGSAHPSGSVGEQDSHLPKGDPSQRHYPGEGAKGTNFDGHKNKTLKLDSSNKWPGNAGKTGYPSGKGPSFDCAKGAESMKVPAATSKPL